MSLQLEKEIDGNCLWQNAAMFLSILHVCPFAICLCLSSFEDRSLFHSPRVCFWSCDFSGQQNIHKYDVNRGPKSTYTLGPFTLCWWELFFSQDRSPGLRSQRLDERLRPNPVVQPQPNQAALDRKKYPVTPLKCTKKKKKRVAQGHICFN